VKRRDFCVRAAQAVSVVGLTEWLAACSAGPTSPTGVPQLSTIAATVNGSTVSVPVGAGSVLQSAGSAALVSALGGVFLVARTGPSTFSVLAGVCTHMACTITGFQGGTYVCPCHGSQFNTSGAVLSGPAPFPLQQFPSQVVNDTLSWTA
jgi:cytochrome b6-f complex iron-sulfur subunit